MAWMAWLLYIFVIYFSMMEVLLSENVVRRPGVSAEQEMLIALKPLDGLCVDNVRTHSWWTYAICFKKSILQVHVDSRTKALSERITLGQFVPEESTAQMQTYRTVDAKCNAPASSTKGAVIKKLPRTTVVHLRCCDVVVHLMRQSRHTVVTDSSGTKSVYWWPEQAAVEASEELRGKFTQHPASTGTATVSADGTFTSTGSNSGGGGYKSTASYRGSMSTATAEAYIHSVEEHSPCNYEITVCSELVCTANGGQSGELFIFLYKVHLLVFFFFVCPHWFKCCTNALPFFFRFRNYARQEAEGGGRAGGSSAFD